MSGGALIRLAALAAERGVLRRLVLSKPLAGGDVPRKISGRLTERRGRRVIFFEEAYEGGRVAQFALSGSELAERLPGMIVSYGQVDLLTSAGDAVLLRSGNGKETLRGGRVLEKRIEEGDDALQCELTPLENVKKGILRGDEPFLVRLGISDASGRVHDKKQGKLRQINRFLEYVRDTVAALPTTPTAEEKPLLIYDLCCGKSYLSFALYHYLTVTCGRRVSMLAKDLKGDVIRFCAEVADSLGFSPRQEDGVSLGMRFETGDVRELPTGVSPDLVVSLHACDTATDLVLGRAIALGARAILATPCCHRSLDRRIVAEELGFVTRFPKLRTRMAEAMTDALRCLRLEAAGYGVTVAELVDPDDTPKNTILVARKHSTDSTREKARAAYADALRFLLGDGAAQYLALFGGEGEVTL